MEIKLINILSEIKSDQSADIIGDKLDDIFKNELNKASQQQNEGVLTILALVLAIPGFLKTLANIAETIAKKSGIDLKKKNSEAWYKIVEKFADNIDDYIETPFNAILKPFISDNVKRKKIVSFIKGACIAVIAIIGAVDLNAVPTVVGKIKAISGEFTSELLQNAGENNLQKFIEFAKTTVQKIIK